MNSAVNVVEVPDESDYSADDLTDAESTDATSEGSDTDTDSDAESSVVKVVPPASGACLLHLLARALTEEVQDFLTVGDLCAARCAAKTVFAQWSLPRHLQLNTPPMWNELAAFVRVTAALRMPLSFPRVEELTVHAASTEEAFRALVSLAQLHNRLPALHTLHISGRMNITAVWEHLSHGVWPALRHVKLSNVGMKKAWGGCLPYIEVEDWAELVARPQFPELYTLELDDVRFDNFAMDEAWGDDDTVQANLGASLAAFVHALGSLTPRERLLRIRLTNLTVQGSTGFGYWVAFSLNKFYRYLAQLTEPVYGVDLVVSGSADARVVVRMAAKGMLRDLRRVAITLDPTDASTSPDGWGELEAKVFATAARRGRFHGTRDLDLFLADQSRDAMQVVVASLTWAAFPHVTRLHLTVGQRDGDLNACLVRAMLALPTLRVVHLSGPFVAALVAMWPVGGVPWRLLTVDVDTIDDLLELVQRTVVAARCLQRLTLVLDRQVDAHVAAIHQVKKILPSRLAVAVCSTRAAAVRSQLPDDVQVVSTAYLENARLTFL